MWTATVEFEVDAERHREELRPGMVIGRGIAGLRIEHPAVSEAHALCSLREGGLVLLPLRGELRVGGEPAEAVSLVVGVAVEVAPGVVLVVVAVQRPAKGLGLKVAGEVLALPAMHAHLDLGDGPPRWAPADQRPALLEVWSTGSAWMGRLPGAQPFALEVGREVPLAGRKTGAQIVACSSDVMPMTPRPRTLEISQGHAKVLGTHGVVHHDFAGLQGYLIGAVEERTRGGRVVGWKEVAAKLYGGPAVKSHEDATRKSFEKLRLNVTKTIDEERLPRFLRCPRGFLEIDRAVIRVVGAESPPIPPKACPACGHVGPSDGSGSECPPALTTTSAQKEGRD